VSSTVQKIRAHAIKIRATRLRWNPVFLRRGVRKNLIRFKAAIIFCQAAFSSCPFTRSAAYSPPIFPWLLRIISRDRRPKTRAKSQILRSSPAKCRQRKNIRYRIAPRAYFVRTYRKLSPLFRFEYKFCKTAK